MTATVPAPPELDLDDRLRMAGDIVEHRLRGSTPARMRLWSMLAAGLLVLGAIVAWWAASSLVSSSDRAQQNTAPVLVATQDVFASIAEADAASASVFLSGADEDREQRRLYEIAIERATGQLEEVSRLVGDDDEAHDSIKAISANLTTYAGLVESARVSNQNDLPGAEATLLEAIDTVQDGIVPRVQSLTAGAQADLDDDADGGGVATVIAAVVLAVALIVLIMAQQYLRDRTRRLLNLQLVAATVLTLVAVGWLLSSWSRQQDALDSAQAGGYDSIALTADIQTTAFRYKTLESLGLLGQGDAAEQAELATRLAAIDIDDTLVAAARTGDASGDGLLLQANRSADATREQAASAELLVRWDRYLATSQDIALALDQGEDEAAIDLAIGAGNSDFNGFNTAVESVLSDNRSQFLDGVADARAKLDRLQLAMVVLPLLAAALVLWGFQRRISEYTR